MAQKPIFQINQKEQAEKQFSDIADKLFNHWVLVTPSAKYRFTEIEFYYSNICSENIDIPDHFPPEAGIPYILEDLYQTGFPHPDPYTHGFFNQYKNDYWYLHSNEKGLKNGKRKGLDLTIGNEGEFSYGGILIRGIRNITEDVYINGPSRVVDRIIFDMKKKSISEIKDILNLTALDKNNEIYIEEFDFKTAQIKSEESIRTTRFGLTKKKEDIDNFFDKPYRYIIELNNANEFEDRFKIVKQLLIENKITKEQAKNILNYNITL